MHAYKGTWFYELQIGAWVFQVRHSDELADHPRVRIWRDTMHPTFRSKLRRRREDNEMLLEGLERIQRRVQLRSTAARILVIRAENALLRRVE